MEQPLINILIRTSYRPEAFKRCWASIQAQTYTNYKVYVSFDNVDALDYIPDEVTACLPVEKSKEPFGYNLYCNELKQLVTDGWFFFLDDDDVLVNPEALQTLASHIHTSHIGWAIILQMCRGSFKKPSDFDIINGNFTQGKIGMPCIVLHHSIKNYADFDCTESADYNYIKEMWRLVPCLFVPMVLVSSKRRGRGYLEK